MVDVEVFRVVEFDDDGGGISVVRGEWLTPRKKRCFWPPVKVASKFNKLLSSYSLPAEDWQIFKIKKILYETDDLIKAREKCKQAEKESDIVTDEDDIQQRKRKRTQRYEETDDEDDEPVQSLQIKFPDNPRKNPKQNNSPKPTSRLLLQDFNIDTPPAHSPAPSSPAPNSPAQTPRTSQKCSGNSYQSALDRIADLLGDMQFELKEIRETQNDILNKISSSVYARPLSDQLQDMPVALPLKTVEDLNKIETWLEEEANIGLLASHLSFVGGNKKPVITRRILERVFDNSLAIWCNWTGKNNKTSLKNLKLIKAIFDAIRRNKVAESATDTDIIEVLTNWFRFARDRDGAREKRRSTSLPTKE